MWTQTFKTLGVNVIIFTVILESRENEVVYVIGQEKYSGEPERTSLWVIDKYNYHLTQLVFTEKSWEDFFRSLLESPYSESKPYKTNIILFTKNFYLYPFDLSLLSFSIIGMI
jgi:hypothetical protein